METAREMLRHTLATLAYRGGKVLRGAPSGFGAVRATADGRSASEVLAHIGDLFDWAVALCGGEHAWRESPPQAWEADVARFFDGLARFDAWLASDRPLGFTAEKLFQGPVADALTHVGQLALLRRIAGAPVRAENYFRADIVAGRVGPDQTPPRREF
jgi:hypothetical protein